MAINPIISIIDLEIGFRPAAKAGLFYPLISISAAKGDFIGLIGRNGVGKSTFLRSIARLQPNLSGEIEINGRELSKFKKVDFAKTISFIPAEPIHVANMTVFEFVSLARYPYNGWFGSIGHSDKNIVYSALESVNLTGFLNRDLDNLSDGERQRAMVAFAIAQDSEIILMDEPTAFIDLPSKFEIVHLLKKLSRMGKTVIFSTHDLNTAINEVDTIWLMLNDGFRVGSPEDLALNKSLNKLFERTDIYLDIKTGEFLSKREFKGTISLKVDNEIYLTWTKHALERIGYKVITQVNQSVPIVTCNNHDNKWLWEFHESSRITRFDTISALCNFMKVNFQN